MKIIKFIKKVLRQNYYLELISYIIQNNLLRKVNFIGSGNWEPTFVTIYNRNMIIANSYLSFIKNEKINITGETLIIELGVGYSTAACLELSKKTKCFKIIAYDAFMSLKESIDIKIKGKYYPEITNVKYVLGIENLKLFLAKNRNEYNKIIVFSNAVLQHVWNVKELIKTIDEFSQINSVHFHSIDLRNMNKFDKYGTLYFLKFSDFTWSLMANKNGSQNRLRYNNYVKIFNGFGYKVDILNAQMFKDYEIQIAKQTYLKNMEVSKDESLIYSTVSIKCQKIKQLAIE